MSGTYSGILPITSGVFTSNQRVADVDLTTHGSDFLWAVFAIMFVSGLGLTAWTFTISSSKRAFHFMGIAILFTASTAYFSMAADLGATPIAVEFRANDQTLYGGTANPVTRSIWYVRYIDWVITTPLLLLTLLLATGLPLSSIFFTIFMDELMIVTGLVGALVASQYKWGYFTFGCVAMLYVFWTLVGPARSAARAVSTENHSAYVKGALTLSFLWLLYPIAWGLADGANVISTDSEMVFYGILDVLAKPGFIFLHLFSLKSIPYESFELSSGHFSTGSHFHTEKHHNGISEKSGNGVNGTSNGNGNSAVPHVAQTGPETTHAAGTNHLGSTTAAPSTGAPASHFDTPATTTTTA
ncbi:uncharacterized protein L969DRAFT_46108 [Mixia osmundae IAM 14324]|uniref:Uncharacterized protein n=1 Tax=Mixia osmundae (strain CBS 9802 / IAM 14324 / JCM 22182 / KY 12970) TaxID=764103 RepID=G7E689_MIXOS|nr:uncharacterized protein L969DRAFT_46108 [Mixia osmundae IAM 14324]KEI40496.1 hypothetical protein L969DRAFT_46108 [Mixia osmundae IAM 14324]GAA98349.1 hypothetical protein E5Q_05035 [Mixia osmundae IAM 14324]